MIAVRLATLAAGVALLSAPAALATPVSFSDASSDSTAAAVLRASLDYALADPFTLEMAITNETGQDAPFDVSQVFFNGGERVAYLELVHAESSLEGENTDSWYVGYYGYDLLTPAYGAFDFALRTDFRAPAADRIVPGETQRFTLSVRCISYAGCDANDWLSHTSDIDLVGHTGAYAALQFTHGPAGDAAFGAVTTAPAPVPEPAPAALVVLGLVAVALRRRAR